MSKHLGASRKDLNCILRVGMWPGTESNCRHEDFQSSALPTELPGHKSETGILLKSIRESRFRRFAGKRFYFLLDEIDHITLKSHVIERVDFLDARRAGDIYFGKKAADDVQADKV